MTASVAQPAPSDPASAAAGAWQCQAQLYPTSDFDPGARGPLVFAVGKRFGAALPWDQGSGGTGFGQSNDGIAWSSDGIGSPVQMDKLVADLAVGGMGVVAVGAENAGDGTAGSAAVWTSGDGGAWAAVKPGGVAGRVSLRRVAVHEGTVAVLGDFSLYAGDWAGPLAPVVVGPGAHITDVTSTQAGFVAVGGDADGAAVWRSVDARQWVRVPLPGQTPDRVAATGSILLVEGTTDGGADARWRSTDGGASWAAAQDPAGPDGASSTFGLATGFLETGPSSRDGLPVWTSIDGRAWSEHPVPLSLLGEVGVAEGWSAADNGSEVVLAARSLVGTTPGGVALCGAPLAAVLNATP